jgi:hypothetical protein
MSSSMKRVLLALVLCVACVGAMKLPSQLQAINPKAKVHAAIKAAMAKHAPAEVRGSKLLEQDTAPHLAAMRGALVKTLNKLPFTHKLTVPDDKSPSRHLLQQSGGLVWTGVSNECKAVLNTVGVDASRLDDDSYDPQPPAEFAPCEDAVDLALCTVFPDEDTVCNVSHANVQAAIGFCTAPCKDKSLEFLAGLGSVCGPDIGNFFVNEIVKMPESTDEEKLAKAFSMLLPMMAIQTFSQATRISTVMALACTGPSNSELCWSKEWFFEFALASGDDSDDDDDDDCPTGPTYLPPPAEACQDFPTTSDFCTLTELGDCCATNAVAGIVSGEVTSWCPWIGMLENMLRVMGENAPGNPCDAFGAICQDETSRSNFISAAAELVGGCCNPDKPGMCAGAAQKAAKQVRKNDFVPSGGAGAVSAALGLFGAALAAAFV